MEAQDSNIAGQFDWHRLLAYAAYLLVVASGVIGILVAGSPDNSTPLITMWLGFVSIGGLGSAIFGRLGDVSRSLGPANGVSQKELLERVVNNEKYTHENIHAIRGHVAVTTAAVPIILDRLGIDPDEIPKPPPTTPQPPAPPAGVTRRSS